MDQPHHSKQIPHGDAAVNRKVSPFPFPPAAPRAGSVSAQSLRVRQGGPGSVRSWPAPSVPNRSSGETWRRQNVSFHSTRGIIKDSSLSSAEVDSGSAIGGAGGMFETEGGMAGGKTQISPMMGIGLRTPIHRRTL